MDNQQLFPTSEDLAYAAGLIDADGSVGFYRNNKANGLYFGTVLSFYNNDEPSVDWMREVWRSAGVEPHKAVATRGGKVKTQYSITIRKLAHLQKLLPVLIPYMRLKRSRAENVLEFVNERVGRKDSYSARQLDLVAAVFIANGDYRNNSETVREAASRLKRQSTPTAKA